jgi:acetylornithine aminotransferase
VGKRIADGAAALVGQVPLLTGVRGRGLWLALTLDQPAAGAVEAAMRGAGFLVNAVAPDVIRLAPPLVLDSADADAFLAALPGALNEAAATVLAEASPEQKGSA